jgi:hypothetical protein
MVSWRRYLLVGVAASLVLGCQGPPAEEQVARMPSDTARARIDLDDPEVQREIREDLNVALESAVRSGRERADAPAQHIVGRAAARRQIAKDPVIAALLQPDTPEPPLQDDRITEALRMTDDTRYDDFPAIASDPADRDRAFVAWLSYADGRDELRLAAFLPEVGTWSTWNPVPGASGDLWRPSLAFDGTGRLWVFWSQRTGFGFDLRARAFDGTTWGTLVRLTESDGSDFDQRVVRDGRGMLHVVWQGFRSGQSDIFYARLEGDAFSEPLTVSESAFNDWAPALVVDRSGTAWIVWDSYDRGDYDVLLRAVTDGRPGSVREIAATPRYEAQATIALDASDRLWVAYDLGPANWTKDQGRMIPPGPRAPGTRILDARSVEVVCLEGQSVLTPVKQLASLLPERPRNARPVSTAPIFRSGELVADDDGGLHLLFRQYHSQGGFAEYWREWITTLTPDGWSTPAPVPYSEGRTSMRPAAAPAPGGQLHLAWPRDNRPSTSIFVDMPEERMIENIYTGRYRPAAAHGMPELVAFAPQETENRVEVSAVERRQIARLREHRVPYRGRELRVLRGDLHRHTELSVDLGSVPDGSLLDFYRYMLDAADMDFGASTDHQAGQDRSYWWWYGQKLTDLFHTAGGYVGLFGYERSLGYPWGHRNILNAERGVPALAFFQTPETPFRLHLAGAEVLPDDTRLLYEEVRRTDGVSIPHTTATNMGTDWADNDPEVEPLVEIFQGDRFSYEHEGAPWSDPQEPGNKPASEGYRPDGFVWQAWEKGYRLGVIASSDHWSTHMSYAMLLARENSREALVEAMRARHAYGATDNILLDVRMGDAIMGDEITASRIPKLEVRAFGTADLAAVHVIRNNRIAFSVEPLSPEAEFTWRDMDPTADVVNYYYVRAEQADGHLAWSSPIWVNLE